MNPMLQHSPAAEQDDEAFRSSWRAWIAAHYDSKLRNPLEKLTGEEARKWLRAQYRDGWRAPGLAAAYGGMGLSLKRQLIYQEELDRFGVARPLDHGVRMLAPILLRYGTEAQKNYFIPRILSCEDVWCQGYSEPNAGSDLANLRTAAVADGDSFIVNGQKIWTTLATDANMMYMLVRTDGSGRKQEGITFLLVSLDTPGIRVRPIRTLAGEEHLCEVFFDDVRVPRENVVGAVGDGWKVGKVLLGFERYSHGAPELIGFALSVFERTAAALPCEVQASFRELAARFRCDVRDAAALYERLCADALIGTADESEFSLLKLFNAELLQEIAQASTEMVGANGGVLGAHPELGMPEDLQWLYMITRPVTIFGGTSQIQRNLIATRILGLPKA
ncbi:acyl-CoA dehydrogenase [Verticiella sediminum]|uniref:Acyl-CoA dehydrogenase n=1 Tax=Verticiella sediminum TaxID=1247510 RepID=A0A556AKK3_9BURK|nr:acyl-CoA dehydrogenase family protein [Verticiella sediminum]TSH93427.1 acyl-CoA dehydrogenase [Verticiella sediminum]